MENNNVVICNDVKMRSNNTLTTNGNLKSSETEIKNKNICDDQKVKVRKTENLYEQSNSNLKNIVRNSKINGSKIKDLKYKGKSNIGKTDQIDLFKKTTEEKNIIEGGSVIAKGDVNKITTNICESSKRDTKKEDVSKKITWADVVKGESKIRVK